MVKDGFDPIEVLTSEYSGNVEFIVATAVLNEIKTKLGSGRFAEMSKARVAMEYIRDQLGETQNSRDSPGEDGRRLD